MSKYFRLPFATGGTKNTIPETQPVNGAINYTTGYSSVYEGDPATDPNALRVERDKLNELQYQITDTLKSYYETAIPPFITSSMNGGSAFSYSKDALVRSGGVVYSSNINSNTSTPPGANWTVVDMAVFNAKAPTASPTFTGTPKAPTASVAFPTDTLQIANYQFTSDFLQWVGLFGDVPRLATNLDSIIGAGFLYFNSGTSNRSGYSSNGFIFTEFLGGPNDAIQIEWGTTEVNYRVRAGGIWGTDWRRMWSSRNSTVITSEGSNALGYYRVYSNGDVHMTRTISFTAGSGTLYAFPVSVSSVAGHRVSIAQNTSSAPSGAYGYSISTSGISFAGPTGTITVDIFIPG